MMKSYSKPFKAVYILSCIALAALGFITLFYFPKVIKYFALYVGASIIFVGTMQMMKSAIEIKSKYFSPTNFALSFIIIAVGTTILIFHSVPYYILASCLASISVTSSLLKINLFLCLKDRKRPWIWHSINSLFSFVLGVAMLASPLFSTVLFVQITGAYWLYVGAYSIMSIILEKDFYLI